MRGQYGVWCCGDTPLSHCVCQCCKCDTLSCCVIMQESTGIPPTLLGRTRYLEINTRDHKHWCHTSLPSTPPPPPGLHDLFWPMTSALTLRQHGRSAEWNTGLQTAQWRHFRGQWPWLWFWLWRLWKRDPRGEQWSYFLSRGRLLRGDHMITCC